jgi:hypothetical protein
MNQETKFKIVVISIITACYIVTGALLALFCAKTDNWSIMPYIFSIATFSYIVAIYAFIISNNKEKRKIMRGKS